MAVTAWCLLSLNYSLNSFFSKDNISSPLFCFNVSLEKENKSPIDVVKLQVLKSRITGKVPPRYFVFDLETKLLRPEHGYTPSRETSSKIQKAQPDDILAYLKGQELS